MKLVKKLFPVFVLFFLALNVSAQNDQPLVELRYGVDIIRGEGLQIGVHGQLQFGDFFFRKYNDPFAKFSWSYSRLYIEGGISKGKMLQSAGEDQFTFGEKYHIIYGGLGLVNKFKSLDSHEKNFWSVGPKSRRVTLEGESEWHFGAAFRVVCIRGKGGFNFAIYPDKGLELGGTLTF